MAVSMTRFPWWLLGSTKEKETATMGSALTSSNGDWGHREADSIKFPTRDLASERKVKRKWLSREERRVNINKQHHGDFVLVPSDGVGCLSGSESDGRDWEIGWVEPHGVDFTSDDENVDDGFAALVPSYRPGCKKLVEVSNNQFWSAFRNLPNDFSSEGKNYMELLSSVQNF